jgi:hypothetical protein
MLSTWVLIADGGDLAVLDPPEAERAGDVADVVEGDRPDDAFILDRLVLDQCSALANSSLPAWNTEPEGSSTVWNET